MNKNCLNSQKKGNNSPKGKKGREKRGGEKLRKFRYAGGGVG